jgi:hypothetical protein
MFACALRESPDSVKVTWLKDNKPLTDRLMDRVLISADSSAHKLQLQHCREDDSGVYTARAENVKGNTHCTAQLIVQECESYFFLLESSKPSPGRAEFARFPNFLNLTF